ncbi:hypothetical protein LHV18_22890 [Providencia rettgeri]|uniref:hypothetical protein n=3 Tax=Morganellaceae TaxID=1903414 RepID=UPI001CFD5DCB|nr:MULTISPECIES: hypothetical protein [Providencia]MCB4843449.1 hypothetical protein [Providencia rettgeri]MCG5278213.1 hypothetical protein [Providencia rettgeri]
MFACEIRFVEISNRYARIEAAPLHEYLFLLTDLIEFIFRNHHHVSLRYFGHLRLTRQQEGSPPVTLSGLFFRNAFIQLFAELSWFIEALCCHGISPLKSPAIARPLFI